MNGITYQEAVSRIDRCIAEIKAAAMENADLGNWLEVGYLAYELEKFITSRRNRTEASYGK